MSLGPLPNTAQLMYCTVHLCTISKLYMYWPNLPTYYIRLVFWGACANDQFFRAFRLPKKANQIDEKINITDSC